MLISFFMDLAISYFVMTFTYSCWRYNYFEVHKTQNIAHVYYFIHSQKPNVACFSIPLYTPWYNNYSVSFLRNELCLFSVFLLEMCKYIDNWVLPFPFDNRTCPYTVWCCPISSVASQIIQRVKWEFYWWEADLLFGMIGFQLQHLTTTKRSQHGKSTFPEISAFSSCHVHLFHVGSLQEIV